MGPSEFIKDRFDRWVDSRLDEGFRKKLKALPTRQNEYGFDSFGFHRDDAKVAALIARFFQRDYFRAETHGIEHVPDGRVLLIANHSGQLPFDGIAIGGSLLFDRDPPRLARAMVEKYIPTPPSPPSPFPRFGNDTATTENCVRLLEEDEAILVFPEGARGISKPFHKRYQLQEFGLGFMRLALRTGTPIVPVAVVGAEEQLPAVNLERLARLIGAPALPLTFFPPLLPIPLPTKYRIYFGEPETFTGDPDDDDEILEEMVKRVRARIQSMLMVGLAERKHIFW